LEIVANEPIGKTVQVKINRDGREMTVPITIDDRANVMPEETAGRGGSPDTPDQGSEASLGLRVSPITQDQVRRFGLQSTDGVMVTAVERGSVADEAGLDQGWIIRQLIAGTQRVEIRNMEDFRRAEKMLRSGPDFAFMVLRPDPRTNSYTTAFVPFRIP